MSKRTFKSASASRKTSSRSGASAGTVTMGKTSKHEGKALGEYTGASKTIRDLSPGDFKKMLLRVGIIKANGSLAPKYASAK